MASYYINLLNDGSGNWSVNARRGGDAASGGTALTLPWVDNTNAGANTTTRLLGNAAFSAFRAIQNDLSVNGDTGQKYHINLAESLGVFTPTARKNGTDAANGTAITIPWVENNNAGGSNTTSKLISAAFMAALRAIQNDRSVNG
jgi:hypothetical protein